MKENIEKLMKFGATRFQALIIIDMLSKLQIPEDDGSPTNSFIGGVVTAKINLELDKQKDLVKQEEAGPKFKHDCEECQFLGHFRGHDLYYCNQGDPSLIARYGNSPKFYISGMCIGKENKGIHNSEMGEAYRRAVKKGLIVE